MRMDTVQNKWWTVFDIDRAIIGFHNMSTGFNRSSQTLPLCSTEDGHFVFSCVWLPEHLSNLLDHHSIVVVVSQLDGLSGLHDVERREKLEIMFLLCASRFLFGIWVYWPELSARVGLQASMSPLDARHGEAEDFAERILLLARRTEVQRLLQSNAEPRT